MKNAFLVTLLSLLSFQSFGATVKAAKLDASKKNILIDVSYAGGCGKHDFSLKLGRCLESYPVQCTAELVEKTDDHCEALLSSTVVISLEQYQLNTPYFKNAVMKITGDLDWQTNKASQATVTLP